jgi:ribosomal protein L44E
VPEHYTKNTLECTAYCNRCGGDTQHRVDDGRRGPCLECIRKLELKNEFERIKRGIEEEERAEKDRMNPKLF